MMHFDSAAVSLVNRYTPEKLTELLSQRRLLQNGRVIKAAKKVENITLVSHIVKIELLFSPDTHSLCHELFLKTSRTDIGHIDNTREALFYEKVARQMEDPPTPLVLDTFYHEQLKASCILLVNLSQTHFHLQASYPLMPEGRLCARVVERLAGFHAYWWDNPRLEQAQFQQNQDAGLNVQALASLYEAFAESMQEWLSGAIKDIYGRILANFELVFAKGDRHNTIIHGDAHLGNVLYPKSEDGEVVFVDWPDWKIGKAMDDLAYMLALGYFPDQKKKLEPELIKLHTSVLNEKGISYSLADALNEYKMAVVRCMFIPILQWSYTLPPDIWFYNFERVVSSFWDLDCMELI